MKRHLITNALSTLLGVFMSISATYGQEQDYNNKIHIGLKIGVNTSAFTKQVGVFDQNSRGYANSTFAGSSQMLLVSGNIGLTADYNITDIFSISTELLLNGKGSTYYKTRDDVVFVDTAGNETNGHDEYNARLYYLEMPLILRYNMPIKSQKMNYSLYAGIAPAINVSSDADYSYYTVNDDGDFNQTTTIQNLPDVRNFQLNTLFGFYMEGKPTYDTSTIGFIDIRFEQSYTPIFTNTTYHEQNYQTGVWNLNFSFGIKF